MTALILAAVLAAAAPITLDQTRQQARQNTNALQSELDHQRAVQSVRTARAPLLPQVTLGAAVQGQLEGPTRRVTSLPDGNGGYVQSQEDYPAYAYPYFDLRVSVEQIIYDASRWAQLAQAGHNEEAAAGQAVEQVLTSELEAVRRFYTLFRAQRSLQVLEEKVKSSESQLERARALFEAGRRRKDDVLAASVNLGNDRIAALNQRNQMASAQADLATWLARRGEEELEAVDPGTLDQIPATPPAFDRALEVARQNRPLLKALAAQVRAADSAIDVARAGYVPRISVSAAATRQGADVNPYFTDITKQNGLQGQLNLSWNLFSGFATSAQVQDAEYARRKAQLTLDQTEKDLAGEIKKTLRALEILMQAAEVAKLNREVASDGLHLVEERFNAGAATTLEVRDAQVKLTDAELTFLASRIDVETARAALERSMGTLSAGGVAP